MALTSPPANPAGSSGVSADLAAADSAAETLLRQSRSETLRPSIDPARESALDDAFAEVTGTPPPDSSGDIGRDNGGVRLPISGEPKPGDKPPADPEPKSAPKPADKPEDKPAPKPAPKPADKPARKGLLDDLISDPAAPAEKDDPAKAYDDIKLRSDASEKTSQSFDSVKARAIERENAVRAEVEKERQLRLEVEAKLTEAEKKVGAVPEDVAKELKEHREYRALHDVASRPEFKEKFDKRIESNYDTVYSIFKQEEMSDENIAKLRALPENERQDFIEKNVLPRLTPGQRRVVEAKIFDNVNISQEKEKALAEARTNADKILAEQREVPAREQAAKDKEFADTLRPMLQKLPYVYFKEVPTTATAAEKAAIEAHNAFAKELQGDITKAIAAPDATTRAEVVLAVPLARYLSKQVAELTARAETAEAKLKAISSAGQTGRLGRASATTSAAAVAPKTDVDGSTAVDDLFRQYQGTAPR